MTDVAAVVWAGGRFAPDPLSPGRERWWDGWHWTARVREPEGAEGIHWTAGLDEGAEGSHWTPDLDEGTEGIHWTPDLAALARPADLVPEPEQDAPTLPSISFAPLVLTEPLLARSMPEPMPAPVPTPLPDDDLHPCVPEVRVPGSARRRIVTAVGVAAAAALIAGAAAAGAGVFTPTDERPQVEHALAYRDGDAEFALRYPEEWRVLRRERGSSIRFAIASPGAPVSETNSVSVVVGASAADIPPLHTLADQLTEMLRKKLPDVQLDLATRMRVASAPGFRFAFRDPSSSPATRIEQYVGQTANGRPLTVTVTVREPRTAPTETELGDFLASLRSGKLAARA